jgi:hypothetical protein
MSAVPAQVPSIRYLNVLRARGDVVHSLGVALSLPRSFVASNSYFTVAEAQQSDDMRTSAMCRVTPSPSERAMRKRSTNMVMSPAYLD